MINMETILIKILISSIFDFVIDENNSLDAKTAKKIIKNNIHDPNVNEILKKEVKKLRKEL